LKKVGLELKWMAGHSRSFVFSLLFLSVGGAIMAICGVGFALASRTLIDAATGANHANVWSTGAVMGAVILLQISLQSAISVVSTRTTEQLGNQMRRDLFNKLARTEWISYSAYHSGDIITRMTSDVSNVVSGMTGLIPGLVALGAQFLAAFVALYFFDPVIAILAFFLGPLMAVFAWFIGRKLKTLHLRCQESDSRTRSFLQEVLQNLLVVKVFNLEEPSSDRLQELQSQHLNWVVKRSWLGVASGAGLSFGFWLGYFLAIAWGSYRLSSGMITFGTMAAFLQLVGQVQGPFFGFARSLPTAVAMVASAGRLMELEGLPVEIRDEEQSGTSNPVGDKYPLSGILVEEVSFCYNEDAAVLDRFSMEVRPGEVVALVGPSGEGKTTIMRLLLALVVPAHGKIFITGGPEGRQEASPATRKLFSFVPQGNTVFSGTIEENLRMGNPDATREEIEKCARMACAWEFISELPEGMGTMIGERGLGLSEGQAQRLAIARALLRRTPILLLDEATSALDVETEARVLKAIRSSNPPRTCVVVTHRPSVSEVCDRIYQIT